MSDISLDQWLLIDDEIIAELREVMEEEFADLISSFLNDLPVQLDLIQEAIARSDAVALYRIAHKFKSSCGSLGAMRLAELFRRLEQAGRQNALEGIAELLAETRGIAQETVTQLVAML